MSACISVVTYQCTEEKEKLLHWIILDRAHFKSILKYTYYAVWMPLRNLGHWSKWNCPEMNIHACIIHPIWWLIIIPQDWSKLTPHNIIHYACSCNVKVCHTKTLATVTPKFTTIITNTLINIQKLCAFATCMLNEKNNKQLLWFPTLNFCCTALYMSWWFTESPILSTGCTCMYSRCGYNCQHEWIDSLWFYTFGCTYKID